MAAVHIRYIKAMPQTNLNLNIIPSLTLEQIQLGYALLSATIPNLKSFIMSFDTAMMMDISYKLTQDEFIGRLRPDRLEHVTGIYHIDEPSNVIDGPSMESGRDSQERTIRRDMQWKVEESFEEP